MTAFRINIETLHIKYKNLKTIYFNQTRFFSAMSYICFCIISLTTMLLFLFKIKRRKSVFYIYEHIMTFSVIYPFLYNLVYIWYNFPLV